jgi:hypothetical protein
MGYGMCCAAEKREKRGVETLMSLKITDCAAEYCQRAGAPNLVDGPLAGSREFVVPATPRALGLFQTTVNAGGVSQRGGDHNCRPASVARRPSRTACRWCARKLPFSSFAAHFASRHASSSDNGGRKIS